MLTDSDKNKSILSYLLKISRPNNSFTEGPKIMRRCLFFPFNLNFTISVSIHHFPVPCLKLTDLSVLHFGDFPCLGYKKPISLLCFWYPEALKSFMAKDFTLSRHNLHIMHIKVVFGYLFVSKCATLSIVYEDCLCKGTHFFVKQ